MTKVNKMYVECYCHNNEIWPDGKAKSFNEVKITVDTYNKASNKKKWKTYELVEVKE